MEGEPALLHLALAWGEKKNPPNCVIQRRKKKKKKARVEIVHFEVY